MKQVFITGVSRGNGRAFAEKFLAAGWQVVGTSTSGDSPFEAAQLTMHRLDLSQPEQIQHLAEKLLGSQQQFAVFINNAGINLSSKTEYPTKTLSVETLRETLQVNLIGAVELTEKLLPAVQGGQIINVSTGAGAFHPFIATGASSYQISKAALNMYTTTLAARLQSSGTNVWAFDPGWVKTDMGGPQATKTPAQAADELYALVMRDLPTGTFWQGDGERDW